MKMISIALIATALIYAQGARAQPISVYKSASCGDYVREKSDQLIVEMASQYVRGYLSAYNVYAKRNQIITDLPSSTIGLYVEKFCRDNPLLGVHNAAAFLALELSGASKPKSQ
jgi:hypothetical protein